MNFMVFASVYITISQFFDNDTSLVSWFHFLGASDIDIDF